MIDSVKSYGSYKLVKYIAKVDDADEEQKVSTCVIPNRWTPLTLIGRIKYNEDTSIFRFSLPNGHEKLSLPIFSHLLVCAPGENIDGTDAIRPYTSISDETVTGYFEIMVKRYDEWGTKETPKTHFLFTKTDHSFKPPGRVSNHIHRLQIGDQLLFQHNRYCLSRISEWPMVGIRTITMLVVGAGIAPMIYALSRIFGQDHDIKVSLLYGVREVKDILLRETLDHWRLRVYPEQFRVVYCVGSRWNNVHLAAKSEYVPPKPPAGFDANAGMEQGWVNEAKIRAHGYPPSLDGLVFVCGLPGIYDKLCGPRSQPELAVGSALHTLGYDERMVVKL